MNKIPRFATEYRNYCIKQICDNDLMQLEIKQKTLENIDKYYHCLKWGYISINEYMNALATHVYE